MAEERAPVSPIAGKRCQDFLQHLSLYIDHELSAQLCEDLEHHLTECPDCEVVIDTLERTVALYRTLPQPEMPDRLRKRIYHTLHLERYLNVRTPDNGNEADHSAD